MLRERLRRLQNGRLRAAWWPKCNGPACRYICRQHGVFRGSSPRPQDNSLGKSERPDNHGQGAPARSPVAGQMRHTCRFCHRLTRLRWL